MTYDFLSDAENEALKTPLSRLSPDGMRLAMIAKEKVRAHVEALNDAHGPVRAGYIGLIKDCEPFTSPVTKEVIGGKAQLREHLKRTDCRIVEPSERKSYGI